mmetsp:Transcript_39347/g.100890  ORF Transcript_39347/g.100890 Transcript_39347/m.100890 type:complete len:119 (+) Transcript_39347:1583-1939(+)
MRVHLSFLLLAFPSHSAAEGATGQAGKRGKERPPFPLRFRISYGQAVLSSSEKQRMKRVSPLHLTQCGSSFSCVAPQLGSHLTQITLAGRRLRIHSAARHEDERDVSVVGRTIGMLVG